MAFFSLLPQNFILPGLLQGAAFSGQDIPAAVLLCVLFAVVSGYFAFWYFALKRALKEMNRDLLEIQKDVSRNQILHLPLPDRTLEQVMESVNGTLEGVRRQRLEYEKREAEFQKQIEDISHDLRTPLTVILGYLTWMKRDMAQTIDFLQMESSDIPEQVATQATHPHQTASSDIPEQRTGRIESPNIAEQHTGRMESLNIAEQHIGRIEPSDIPEKRTKRTASSDIPEQRTAQKAAWEIFSRQAESLEILERNARAMERLVSQFYAFSQLNARDYSLEIRDVDVCRLLKESLAGHWQMLEKACLRLESHLPEHPVMVRGNKDACERIFANMLQNAGRYAHNYLDIHMSESCGLVQVLFQNDSVRLKEDDIPNLFNRFYRNDAARSQGGSGLGLTIAKSLAEAMGGTLTAQALPRTEPPYGQDTERSGHPSLSREAERPGHPSLSQDAERPGHPSPSQDADDAVTTIRFTLTLASTAVVPPSTCPGDEALGAKTSS